MSDRNSSDYLNLDNFDESLDSRDYRRRQSVRRSSTVSRPSYNRRRPPNRRRRRRRRRNRTRIRNRIIIVTSFLLVITLLVTLIVLMFRGCGKKPSPAGVSTDIKAKQSSVVQDTTAAATGTNQGQDTGNKLSPTTFIAARPNDNQSMGEMSGAIYVWNNEGFELFGGSEEMGKAYAETVNNLAGKVGDMTVYSIIIPNHTEMGLPDRLKSEAPTTSQADNIKAAYGAMDTEKVKPINVYNYLSEHCNEYIYFKSDHHWTGLGAYYAYCAVADTLGMPGIPLSDCTEKTIEGFTGTLTSLAEGLDTDTVHYWHLPYSVKMDITDSSGNVNSYDSPYFDGEEGGSLAYGVFIYGDNPLTVLRSESPNAPQGKKIAVVKESYGNAFVPYLTNNYEEVHVIDLRSFRDVSTDDLAAYCRNNDINELMFLNGVMSANNQMQLDSMTALFN